MKIVNADRMHIGGVLTLAGFRDGEPVYEVRLPATSNEPDAAKADSAKPQESK